MFLVAGAGCGKSVTLRHTADTLGHNNTILCCHFFFRGSGNSSDTVSVALTAVLHQLCCFDRTKFVPVIEKSWNLHQAKLTENVGALWACLLDCSRAVDQQVVVIFDALDEAGSTDRYTFMQLVNDYYRTNKDQTALNMIISGRPYFDMEFKFQTLYTGLASALYDMEQIDMKDEINGILYAKISELDLSQSNREYLVRRLQEKQAASRNFLWLRLVMDHLRYDIAFSGASKSDLDKLIANTPASVDDAYQMLLTRSPDQSAARSLLALILGYGEGISLNVLQIAFNLLRAGVPESIDLLDLQDTEAFGRRIRTLCGLLVTITGDAVYIFHETARDFLYRSKEPSHSHEVERLSWKRSITEFYVQQAWAEVCGKYLQRWHKLGHPTTDLKSPLLEMHFVALQRWFYHYAAASACLLPESQNYIPKMPGWLEDQSEQQIENVATLVEKKTMFCNATDMGDQCFWSSRLTDHFWLTTEDFWTKLVMLGFAFESVMPLNRIPLTTCCWYCGRGLCSCPARLALSCSDLDSFLVLCSRWFSANAWITDPELYAIHIRGGARLVDSEDLMRSWTDRSTHVTSASTYRFKETNMEGKLALLKISASESSWSQRQRSTMDSLRIAKEVLQYIRGRHHTEITTDPKLLQAYDTLMNLMDTTSSLYEFGGIRAIKA